MMTILHAFRVQAFQGPGWRLGSLWLGGFLGVLLGTDLVSVQAQPTIVRRFPLDDYYSSLAWLREGRVLEAQYGFETAYRASRQVNDEHGIDSVPVLIRIGQTLCLQGDMVEGLKQIEAGLLLANRSRGWTRFMQDQPMLMRGLSNEIRGIHWYNSQRNTEPGAFPDSWPVAIGIGTLLLETAPGEVSPVVEAIRLDAIEVYLAQALGLRLRYRMLGEMASELPISRVILEAFPAPRADFPEVLQRCHNICRALALIAIGDMKAAVPLLQSNLEVQGGWDHPLTGVGLLALADIAIQSDDRPTAIRMLSESTLIFARLGQHDWLAEAVERLATVSAVRRQPGSLDMMNEMASWLRTRSYLSHTATLASIAGLAAELDNYPLAESLATQALRKTAKTVGPLPHLQTAARFALARAMIKQGRSEAGRTALEVPIKLAQGVNLPGPLSSSLIQLRWLEWLLDSNQLSPSVAVKLFDRWLEGPSRLDWMYEPCSSLATAMSNVSESGFRWLGLVARQGNQAATIQAIDRLHRIQCRYYLPLAGRELDLRLLFHADRLRLPEGLAPQVLGLRKQFPTLDQSANLVQRQISAAQKVKSIDPKNWNADEKQLWSQLGQQCELQEQRLLDASTSRTALPQVFPPATTLAELQSQLVASETTEARAILGFFVSPQATYGYLITADRVELWNVDRALLAQEKQRQLLDAMGVGKLPGKVLAAVTRPVWQTHAKELQALLVPSETLKRLADASHLTVIPHDWLWYVPFELLPDKDSVIPSQPWLARHSLSYAPTLGIASANFLESEPALRTLGVTRGGFFVADRELDSALTKGILESVDGTQHVDVPSKVHDSRWSRLQFDQVWVAATTTLEFGVPVALMAYDAGDTTSLQQWLQLPLWAPKILVLAGNEIPGLAHSDANGLELFRLACCLAAMGNRATLVNRWSPHGESAQLLVKSFLESTNEVSAAQAWRRSVLSLWETPLQYTTEPILGTIKKDTLPEELFGSHPIFWSGTMTLGNTQPAQNPQ